MRDDLFKYGPGNIREFFKEHLAAILYTIIFHLVILIVLVNVKIEGLKQDKELGVMIDFSKEKSLEDMLKEQDVEVPDEWLKKVYEAREKASNRAVNVNDVEKEDISTKDFVNEILDELEQGKDEKSIEDREKWKEIISSYVYDEPPAKSPEKQKKTQPFTGPTTITYEFLEQPLKRQKVDMVIPVYLCEGSGDVTVEVKVHRDGTVSDVSVVSTDCDSDPTCFVEAARSAAGDSRFMIDLSAPEKQRARITYHFIAQ